MRLRGHGRLVGPPDEHQEDGFILLESLIAIALITIVMAALASLTINVVSGTSELRARQGAVQLAQSTMSGLAAIPPTDLVTVHDTDQFAGASATVQPWLTTMTPVSVTTSPAQTLNNVAYAVRTYLGRCRLAAGGASGSTCDVNGTGTSQLRAVVAVSWSGTGCRSSACAFVTATLVNTDADPVFNTNRAAPAGKPVVVSPGDQVSTRGTAATLQLTTTPGTGVAPLSWAVTSGALPTGLTLSGSGLVSGTPTALAAPTPLTVTVSDVFGRTGSATFSWSVVSPPTIGTPAAQRSVQGSPASLAVSATCPNSPCSYTASGLPAGLSISAGTGTISGTPTTQGTSSVTVTVTDAAGATATTSPFAWTIAAPASVAAPGTLRATVGTTVTLAVAYNCPIGPCTLTLAGTAPGVGLSTTAFVGSANSTTTLTVSTGAGVAYLAGLVQNAAVPTGTSKAYSPTLSIAGSTGPTATSGPGDWIVYTPPTVGPLGSRTVTVGSSPSLPVSYTCPNTPCTLTLGNPVPGVGLSTTTGPTGNNTTTTLTVSATTGTVYVGGTVAAGAVPAGSTSRDYPMTLTITDNGRASASSTGTWTATTNPRLINPGAQAAEPNQAISLQMTAECPNGGCTWRAEVLYAGFIWVSVPIDARGRITYAGAPAGSYTVRVTVTDSTGVSDQVTFPLTVQTFTLAVPAQTTTKPASGTTVATLDVSTLVRPAGADYSYSLSGQPSWLTIDANGLLTATVTPTSASDLSITVTVTSTASPTSSVSSTFAWRVQ